MARTRIGIAHAVLIAAIAATFITASPAVAATTFKTVSRPR